jgi:hypothetical protein
MTGKLEECLFKGLGPGLFYQFFRRALRDYLSMIDDRDLLRIFLCFFHIMCCEKYCDILFFVEFLDIFPHMISCLGIKALGRLVQKEYLGVMQQSSCYL